MITTLADPGTQAAVYLRVGYRERAQRRRGRG
jgi:hypothetical protein